MNVFVASLRRKRCFNKIYEENWKVKAKLWHQQWHLCWSNNIRGPRRLSGTLLNDFPGNVKIYPWEKAQLFSHLQVFTAFALEVEKLPNITKWLFKITTAILFPLFCIWKKMQIILSLQRGIEILDNGRGVLN